MKTLQITKNQTLELHDSQTDLIIEIQPGVEVTLIETAHHENITLEIAENAIVNYISVRNGEGKAIKRAILQRNAVCHWRSALLSGNLEQEITSSHVGDGASSDHHGIFLGKDHDRFIMNYWNEHTAKHTSGNIVIHGVLFDNAYANFIGNIKIAQSAADTDGSLTEATLLLGQHSRSDSVPQLEIDTNDVKAAHSSSITRIDDEQLFYLQSRGISTDEGKRMIVRGFLEGIVDEFPDDAVCERIAQTIEQRLEYV